MRHKITKIASVILLANLLWAQLAFAQGVPPTTPPPTTPDIWPGLNTKGWNQAQSSKDYCLGEFWQSVNKASQGVFKTVYLPSSWYKDTFGNSQTCIIVLAAAPVPIDAQIRISSQWYTYAAQSFEVAIASSTQGILKQASIDAANQARNERQGASIVSTAVGWALNGILSVIAAILGSVTALAGSIFSSSVGAILKVDTLPNVVNIGWAVVRDICNMFFILGLIVIAIAAILRLEEYDYKHLIGELVLMAILVNFSKVIALTIMNVVNFLAAIFYTNGLGTDILKTIFNVANPVNSLDALFLNGWQAGLVDGIGKVLFMLVGTVVFVALAIMFVIRLVGLYVLIIFSPIAFAARILPATHHFAEEWWSKFIKYLIWAPVALFMIRLTIIVAKTINDQTSSFLSGGVGGNDSAFYTFILCGFLAAALLVAEEAGMVGGEAVVHGVKHVGKELGGAALGLVGRSYTKAVTKRQEQATEEGRTGAAAFWKAAQFANVRVAKEAWEQRSKEKEEEAYLPAVGHAHDTLNRAMPTEWYKEQEPGKWHLGQKTF